MPGSQSLVSGARSEPGLPAPSGPPTTTISVPSCALLVQVATKRCIYMSTRHQSHGQSLRAPLQHLQTTTTESCTSMRPVAEPRITSSCPGLLPLCTSLVRPRTRQQLQRANNHHGAHGSRPLLAEAISCHTDSHGQAADVEQDTTVYGPMGARGTRAMCTNAASGGHLEVLQWLRAKGCEWDSFTTCAFQERRGELCSRE